MKIFLIERRIFMNLNITGKDFELTDSIKEYINEKVGKLEKYFGSDFDAVATLKIEGNNQVAEIRVNIFLIFPPFR